MEQNKMRTYILYAIGEIFLVVIGILIALQVNNWNEERKQLQDIELLLNEMTQMLDQNRQSLNIITNRGFELDSTFKVILSEEFDRELIEKDPEILRILFLSDHPIFTDVADYFNSEALKVALSREREFPDRYHSLLTHIRLIESVLNSLSKSTQLLNEFRNDTETYLLEKHPYLYLDDEESVERSIQYALNDPEFKARVRSYQQKVKFPINNLSFIKTKNILALSELHRIDHGYTVSQIDSLWAESGFKKYNSVSCTTDIEPNASSIIDVRYFGPILNAHDQPVTFEIKSYEYSRSRSLEPHAMTFYSANDGIFKYTIEGECRQIVLDNRNGYIVLE